MDDLVVHVGGFSTLGIFQGGAFFGGDTSLKLTASLHLKMEEVGRSRLSFWDILGLFSGANLLLVSGREGIVEFLTLPTNWLIGGSSVSWPPLLHQRFGFLLDPKIQKGIRLSKTWWQKQESWPTKDAFIGSLFFKQICYGKMFWKGLLWICYRKMFFQRLGWFESTKLKFHQFPTLALWQWLPAIHVSNPAINLLSRLHHPQGFGTTATYLPNVHSGDGLQGDALGV